MMQRDHSQSLKRVVIYTKRSQFRPLGDTYSIQAQVDTCKAYCAERGYMLSEDQTYANVREGTLHAHPSERDQTRIVGSALEIAGDAQSEQHH